LQKPSRKKPVLGLSEQFSKVSPRTFTDLSFANK